MDWLSRLLDLVPVAGHLDIHCTFGAPWRVDHAPAAPGEIQYHVVIRGSAVVGGGDGLKPERLEAGDILILPDGASHLLHDGSGAAASPITRRPGVNVLIHENAGTGAAFDMLCGRFLLSVAHIRLLRRYLPTRLIIRREFADARLSRLIDLMREEVVSETLGGRALLNAFSAALFTIAMRSASAPQDVPTGLLALVKHPRLAPALSVLFEQPAHPWTLPELAGLCHMSRATFARHFQETVGRSAADLLADIRMTLAANQLQSDGISTAAAAQVAGYQSEAAFQRMFKERLGMTPAQWRRNAKAQGSFGD